MQLEGLTRGEERDWAATKYDSGMTWCGRMGVYFVFCATG